MTPLGRYVFIKLNPPPTKNGIILPNAKPNSGVVESVGGMVRKVSKGQTVYFSPGAVIKMEEGNEFVIIHEDNIWSSKTNSI